MNSNKLAGIIVAVIVLIGAGAFILSKDKTDSPSQNSSTQESSTIKSATNKADTNASSSDLAGPITVEQVALHNSKTDCWTIVDGGVYDITSYVPRHPGGDEILRACGADGSSLFNSRTTSDGETVGSGEPHSNNASKQLESLKIGDLSQ